MHDMPLNPVSKDLSDKTKSYLDDMMKDMTIKEMRAMNNYISDCYMNMQDSLEENVTMDDFDKIKKKSTTSIPTQASDKSSDPYDA